MRARIIGIVPALFVVVASVSAGESEQRWNSLSSPAFTQCLARTDCVEEPPCSESVVALLDDCSARCGSPGAGGRDHCWTDTVSSTTWTTTGFSSVGICPGWDTNVVSRLHVTGERLDEATFHLRAQADFFLNEQVEVAVFRFDGDPLVFDELEFSTAIDLVLLGIIQPDDILFQGTLAFPGGPDELEENIDVTGIPDSEIVILASGTEPDFSCSSIPVPASSPVGMALVALLVAGTGGWVLRRRSPSRSRSR
jgi:hypothetical protein